MSAFKNLNSRDHAQGGGKKKIEIEQMEADVGAFPTVSYRNLDTSSSDPQQLRAEVILLKMEIDHLLSMNAALRMASQPLPATPSTARVVVHSPLAASRPPTIPASTSEVRSSGPSSQDKLSELAERAKGVVVQMEDACTQLVPSVPWETCSDKMAQLQRKDRCEWDGVFGASMECVETALCHLLEGVRVKQLACDQYAERVRAELAVSEAHVRQLQNDWDVQSASLASAKAVNQELEARVTMMTGSLNELKQTVSRLEQLEENSVQQLTQCNQERDALAIRLARLEKELQEERELHSRARDLQYECSTLAPHNNDAAPLLRKTPDDLSRLVGRLLEANETLCTELGEAREAVRCLTCERDALMRSDQQRISEQQDGCPTKRDEIHVCTSHTRDTELGGEGPKQCVDYLAQQIWRQQYREQPSSHP